MQRKFLRRDRACVCGQRGGGKGKLLKLVERGRTPTLSVRIGSRTFRTGHLMKAVLTRMEQIKIQNDSFPAWTDAEAKLAQIGRTGH